MSAETLTKKTVEPDRDRKATVLTMKLAHMAKTDSLPSRKQSPANLEDFDDLWDNMPI